MGRSLGVANSTADIDSGVISGATINNCVIGGTTPAAGSFTTLSATSAYTATGGVTLPANADIVFTGTTGTNDITLVNGLADALSITDGSADIVVINTSTAGNVITVSSAVTATGNISLGTNASSTLGFYGTTPAAQRASSVQATTNIASSSDFGETQLAVVQEIMNTLTACGLWKGAA